ncbi:MAG: S41 family peptidase [Candidatus Kapabacteria bacterium]|nr:S41 family peptidase [Candidatus Kapabacteria bacterium]
MKKGFIFLSILFVILLINNNYSVSQPLMHPYNLDFEEGEVGKIPRGWSVPMYAEKLGYFCMLTDEMPAQGKYSLKLIHNGEYKEGIYGSVMQSIDAKPYAGRNFKLRAAIRAEITSPLGSAHLWIRVHRPNKETGFADIMDDRPIVLNSWAYYEIEGTIDPDAEMINYGLLLKGSGRAWIDDVSFTLTDVDNNENSPPKELSTKAIENLSAFARLFGYVRYFYPSSEAQMTNWQDLALAGVEMVETAKNSNELLNTLNNLFNPIAPLLQIKQGTKPNDIQKNYESPPTALKNLALVWKHIGPSTQLESQYLRSEITNVFTPQREFEGAVIQVISAKPLLGKKIIFSSSVKTDLVLPAGHAQLWLVIEGYDGKPMKTITMNQSPIRSTEWKEFSLEADVPEDANTIRLGLILIGDGKAFFDNTKLYSIDDRNINFLNNPGFEEGDKGKLFRGWRLSQQSEKIKYNAQIIEGNAFEGKKYLELSSDKKSTINFPEIGQIYSDNLDGGLYFSMPLTLFADSSRTLPHPDKEYIPIKPSKSENFIINGNDRTSRLAITIILWNIYKHFSTFNNNNKRWDSVLKVTLNKAAIDKNENQFLETLRMLSAHLDDGQARVWLSDEVIRFGTPFLWKWTENKLIITKVAPNFYALKVGDEVISIDGKPSLKYIEEVEKKISGSTTQWKRVRALAEIRAGDEDSELKIKVKDVSGKEKDLIVLRNTFLSDLNENRPPTFQEIRPSVFYVDLTRISDKQFREIIETLKSAKGLILDLRGLIQISEHILGLFIKEKISSLDWSIPVYTMPDKLKVSYQIISNEIIPRNILNPDKIVFLMDERSIGYSEGLLTLVRNNKIGEIVGKTSAGTPGEAIAFRLPGKYNASMTAIKVNLPDGLTLFGNFLEPTIPVTITRKGIIEGKDEILERALKLFEK